MKPQQLQYGAIVPGAQPVSAFIKPGQKNLAQPTQPAQLPQVKGIQTIQQSGTTYVQGNNSFKDLATQLKPFSEQLLNAASTAGLAYAGWQIEQGEQAALEQASEAQARLDEEVETGELNRAAANRKLAHEDPQAGGLMDILNPYRQIGWKRGKAKLAGQAIAAGMAPYVASRGDEINYTSPDQGFAALQKIRADFINSTLQEYGVDRSSPGFTKYVAPNIEKSSDAVAQTLQQDRIKWLDNEKPKTIANLIQTAWAVIKASGSVTFNGQTYVAGQTGFKEAVAGRLNQIANGELMTAGLPGQSGKWRRDAFSILAAQNEMKGEGAGPLDLLTTNVVKRGPNGKPLKGIDGKPRYYSWSELYQKESLDARIRYGQARYTQERNERTELGKQLQGLLMEQTSGIPAGPARFEAGKKVVQEFIEKNGITDPGKIAYLYDAWEKANKSTLSLDKGNTQPRIPVDFVASINARYGTDFNVEDARNQLSQRLAELKPNSPEYLDLQRRGNEAIEAKIKLENVRKNYGPTIDDIVDTRVDGLVAQEYSNNRNGRQDQARGRYKAKVGPLIIEAIKGREAELDRRLYENEVMKEVRGVLDGLSDADLRAIFKGGKKLGADGGSATSATSGGTKPQPMPPTYTISQLGDIPNRRVVLRRYGDTPILDSSAIEATVLRAVNNQQQPKAMRRAWRDAGAPSLFDFIDSQYQLLRQRAPDYVPPWPPEAWNQFRNSTLRSAGMERSLYAHLNQAESRPRLAALQGWLIPTVFEV